MKLLHTSDWHLGMTINNGTSYKADQIFFINKICEIAVEKKVDGILLSGDVFDKSVVSSDVIQLFNDAVTHICGELGIDMYVIAGNHDGAGRLSVYSDLLKKSGLYIAGILTEEPFVVSKDDVDIYLLPWIATDRVKAVYPNAAENINSLEDAYKIVLDDYRSKFVDGQRNVIVSHAFISSAETCTSDHSAEIGTATMISAKVFDGFDYVALGHLHAPQQITENIRYSGTPMKYSFGKEEKQEKSVTIIDTESMSIDIIPLPEYRRRTTLSGTFSELIAADYDEEIVSGYTRLEVSDSYVGIDTIAAFRERYPNLLEISGKTLESEGSKITMTIDDYESLSTEPEEIFSKYCQDILEDNPSEHMCELFRAALAVYEKEEAEK